MEIKQLVVFCTCPDEAAAEAVGRALVAERLAACVNRISGVRSIYRWKGEIHEDGEHLLVIKTRQDLIDDLTRRIVDLHPYELPEVVAVPITAGSDAYLRWIDANTGQV